MSNPTKPIYNFPMLNLRGAWTVETWYDNCGSHWVTALKDSFGNQKGDACFDGHSDGVYASRELLVARHAEMYAELDLQIAESVV